ncbi:MAG: tetratricopeptide repeat protein, partial [Kangiellaceae bacterium]|nr:tetratricopeptide repeat protein [Kangiellaceae bacterium]
MKGLNAVEQKGISLGLSFCTVIMILLGTLNVKAESDKTVTSPHDLEWGAVLYSYYQQDYLSALVEHQYSEAINNPHAKSNSGQLLKGGMLLSYGMAEAAEKIFIWLLNDNTTATIRNSAWYYLANLFYHKAESGKAYEALQNIQGALPEELHTEYHYLATLISNEGNHLATTENLLSSLSKQNPHYAYILFNFAITQLEAGNIERAASNLNQVTLMALNSPELATLADRARHGLAQISLQQGNPVSAWEFLRAIRTSGLYS